MKPLCANALVGERSPSILTSRPDPEDHGAGGHDVPGQDRPQAAAGFLRRRLRGQVVAIGVVARRAPRPTTRSFARSSLTAAGEAALREVRQWRMKNQNWVLACMRDIAAADRLNVAITPEQATRILQGMVATFVVDSALDLRRSIPLDRQVEEAWSASRQTLPKE